MKGASFFSHLRDILILPFTVTVIVPYYIQRFPKPLLSDSMYTQILSAISFFTGLSMFCYTVWLFASIGKGTLAPWSSKKRLIVAGPYRYCRNPMITSVLLILCGEALFLNSLSILEWAAFFFALNTVYFFLLEEPRLEEAF